MHVVSDEPFNAFNSFNYLHEGHSSRSLSMVREMTIIYMTVAGLQNDMCTINYIFHVPGACYKSDMSERATNRNVIVTESYYASLTANPVRYMDTTT
jgi:hypothetical protein